MYAVNKSFLGLNKVLLVLIYVNIIDKSVIEHKIKEVKVYGTD